MTMTARSAGVSATSLAAGSSDWRAAAIAMLSVRLIQGFIYWGGGSRRFIYDPSKLDPEAPSWMANKLQTAIPGALFGLNSARLFTPSLLAFVRGDPAVQRRRTGRGLRVDGGPLDAACGLLSIGLSISLMLLFGWQGGTCIDEWTMASCNVAMGATLMLAGGAAYSLDNAWLRRDPGARPAGLVSLVRRQPKAAGEQRPLSQSPLSVLAFVIAFDVGLYSYYRGSVFTPYHGGPVSAAAHHLTLSNATILADGGVRFTLALDGGTPALPAHVMKVEVVDPDGKALATWDLQSLSALPASAIVNDFPYNRFKLGPYGLQGGMGASAIVTLPLLRTQHPQPPALSCASPTWTARPLPVPSPPHECREN